MHSDTKIPQPFYGPISGTTRVSQMPEENFGTLWCKGRLIEADTPTIRLGATLSEAVPTSTISPDTKIQ